MTLTDLGTFPLPATIWNIVAVHAAIALGALNVIMPLLLGRYAIRRYAGFSIALVECGRTSPPGFGVTDLTCFLIGWRQIQQ
jgi:hypothetical protein